MTELLSNYLPIVIFIGIARKIRTGDAPKGHRWNFFEAFLVFIRDQVARPAIGGHDADRFVPLLWTMFFFILALNLLGMIPWLGAPTGAWGTTFALAGATFAIQLLDDLSKHSVDSDVSRLATHLLAEIEADRGALQDLVVKSARKRVL